MKLKILLAEASKRSTAKISLRLAQQVAENDVQRTAEDFLSRLISGCGILKIGNSNVACLQRNT